MDDQNVIGKELTPEQQETLESILSASYRSTTAFPKPSFDPIPDPAGPNWNYNLPNQPDSAPYIQNLINTQGIAFLPAGIFFYIIYYYLKNQLLAGIYYVGSSLSLNNTNGIIGAGADKTAIIAKDPSVDIIIGSM